MVALDSRVVIEQAKGITAWQHAVTGDQAYQRMRRQARSRKTSLRWSSRRTLGWDFRSEL